MKVNNGLRMEIMRTLVEEGEPVTFRNIKTRSGAAKDADRQLVYYHLEQLVKEGLVLYERESDGAGVYRCQAFFYDKETLKLAEAASTLLKASIGNRIQGTKLALDDAACTLLKLRSNP